MGRTAIMYDGEINNESVAASSAVLERGVQRFPYAWDLPFMLGINYYFEMQPSTPEERTRWRTYGAEMIGRASSLPNAPTFLAPVATSLLAAQGGGRAAYEVASRGVLWAENDLARDSLRTTIRNSGSSDALAWMDAQHHALDSLLAAPSLPTVPPTLIVLLHPDPALAAIPDDEESAAPTTSDAPQ
jgi:hypothetical protein